MKTSPKTGAVKSTESPDIDGGAVIASALSRASERVGNTVFRALWHVALDGAPVTSGAIRHATTSDEAATRDGLAIFRRLTPEEEKGLAQVTVDIENAVKFEFLKMFADARFIAVVRRDAVAYTARRLRRATSELQTEPFVAALRRQPKLPTKDLLRAMEASGVIKSVGKTYQLANGGKAIRAGSSIESKISRLRKQLDK